MLRHQGGLCRPSYLQNPALNDLVRLPDCSSKICAELWQGCSITECACPADVQLNSCEASRTLNTIKVFHELNLRGPICGPEITTRQSGSDGMRPPKHRDAEALATIKFVFDLVLQLFACHRRSTVLAPGITFSQAYATFPVLSPVMAAHREFDGGSWVKCVCQLLGARKLQWTL
jgi:hypothetical protein